VYTTHTVDQVDFGIESLRAHTKPTTATFPSPQIDRHRKGAYVGDNSSVKTRKHVGCVDNVNARVVVGDERKNLIDWNELCGRVGDPVWPFDHADHLALG